MSLVLLVDLSSIFYPIWHMSGSEDVGHASRATFARVMALLDKYEHAAVCADSGASFRKDLWDGYKANRPERDATCLHQYEQVIERLQQEAVCILRAPKYEADDCIATATSWAVAREFNVVIASADKDMLQLVDDRVRVLSTATNTLMGPEEVYAKLGVRPDQVLDFLSLVGDSSDNVPGVRGIGQKHAARLLGEFGTVKDMYGAILRAGPERPPVNPPSVYKALLEGRQTLELSALLVALRSDVPIDCGAILAPRVRRGAPAMGDDSMVTEIVDEETGEITTAGDAVESAPAEPEPRRESAPPPPRQEASKPEKTKPSQAITIAEPTDVVIDRSDPRWAMSLEPQSSGQAWKFACAIARSRLYTKFPNEEAIFAVILRGRSMGLDMMSALDGFHVIEGKPTASAMLIVACVLNSGKAEYFELVESDNTHAIWVTKRKGGKREVSMGFSVEDAHRMGLDKPTRNGAPSNWTKNPRAMCRKQAGVELARAVYPDVVCNVYTPDEMGHEMDDDVNMSRKVG